MNKTMKMIIFALSAVILIAICAVSCTIYQKNQQLLQMTNELQVTPTPTVIPSPIATLMTKGTSYTEPTMPPPKNSYGDFYFVGVCPPYEMNDCATYLQIDGEYFQMAGKDCSNGIVLRSRYNSYALINLEGKYSTLDFYIGHVDKSDMKTNTVTFFVDGQVVYTVQVNPDELPQYVSIPLNKGYLLKIMKSDEWGDVGFSEMIAK